MPGNAQLFNWKEAKELSPQEVPELTEEQEDELKRKQVAIDALFAEKQQAKYKIEIFFSHGRSLRHPHPGALSFWESGTRLHGGGDELIYFCPGKARLDNGCESFIPGAAQGYGFAVCPRCQTRWKSEQVDQGVLARLTTKNWAQLVLKYFVLLGNNCDLYLKHPYDDLRKAAGKEQDKQRMGEDLTRARSKLVRVIYPLRNIIKDTSAGADLLQRISAFLSA